MLKTMVQRKISGPGALGHYAATAVQHKISLPKRLQDILFMEVYFVDSSLLGCDTVSLGEWLPMFYFSLTT